MRLQTNYHTHLAICGHAVGDMEDYIQAALKYQYKELGISDHGPILLSDLPNPYYHNFLLDLQMNYNDFYTYYLPEYKRLFEKYKDQIRLYLGVEIEYFPKIHAYLVEIKKNLDYMILGMHYFPIKHRFHNVYDETNTEEIIAYTDNVVQALDSGLFKIIAHPDIFVMRYQKNNKYIFDETCKSSSKRIIEAAIRNNVYLEINVGGFRRDSFIDDGILKFAYPRYDFWKIVSTYPNALVVIGVDAHDPKHLDHPYIQEAYKLADSLNIVVKEKIEI